MGKKFKIMLILSAILLSSVIYGEEIEEKKEEQTQVVKQEKTSETVSENNEKKEELSLKKDKKENIVNLTLKKVYGFNNEKKSKMVPFVYYIGEAGVMVGSFYFNTDTFNTGGKTTVVMLYGPSTEIATFWGEGKEFKITEKLRLGGTLKLIKYNDIRNYWPGNDSPEEEFSKENYVATGDIEYLKGYRKYHGFNNKIALNAAYNIAENTDLTCETAYEVLKSQVNRYQSDSVTIGIINKNIDNDANPRRGHRVSFNVKKSINLLGKNEKNNWDFYKLIFDARKYFPIFENSTFALRMKTETTGGKKVKDEERSEIGSEIYSYAPFFDMAMLGDFEIMRGSYMFRYWGKNSMLIQSELRFPVLGSKSVQGVLFADIGRVADEYKLKELFTDMNYNGGAGVRYYFNKDILLRVDLGVSEEGIQIRSNLGQAF